MLDTHRTHAIGLETETTAPKAALGVLHAFDDSLADVDVVGLGGDRPFDRSNATGRAFDGIASVQEATPTTPR